MNILISVLPGISVFIIVSVNISEDNSVNSSGTHRDDCLTSCDGTSLELHWISSSRYGRIVRHKHSYRQSSRFIPETLTESKRTPAAKARARVCVSL